MGASYRMREDLGNEEGLQHLVKTLSPCVYQWILTLHG